MPGSIAPPKKAPSADTRSTVIGRSRVHDYGRPIWFSEPINRHGVHQPVDAHHFQPRQPHFQRQVAVGEQGYVIRRAMLFEPIHQVRGRRTIDASDQPLALAGNMLGATGRWSASASGLNGTGWRAARGTRLHPRPDLSHLWPFN